MIRQHDVQVFADDDDLLAQGTFRVVLTNQRRVVTAIDVPDSALGPLHIVVAVSPQALLQSSFATAGLFDDIGHTFQHVAHDVGHTFEHVAHDVGHGLGKAAEGTFNAASKVATTLARPAFEITKGAAAAGASLVGHLPFVPESERKKLEAASRTIMRAHLGDVNAQQFLHAVGEAAKAGVHVAQKAGEAFLEAHRIVGHVLDTPMALVEKIDPKVGSVLHGLDPFVKMDKMTVKLQRGDFEGLKKDIESDAKAAQGVISLIPGIGTGISAAISAGIAVLDGGGPLDIAIQTAYGAIPIPAGIRQITDTVLGAILQLIHNPHNLTDAVLAGMRNAVPAGMARDVFDTLANLIVRHMPIHKAAGQLVDSYVQRYAPGTPLQGIGSTVANAADAAAHGKNVGSVLSGAVGDYAKKAAPGALGEGISSAAHIAGAAASGQNVGAAAGAALGDAARRVAPGIIGEGLAAAAHVAGAAASGKNAFAAAGDVAQRVAPGVVGQGLAAAAHAASAATSGRNPLLAAGDALSRTGVPNAALGAVAQHLPSGVPAISALTGALSHPQSALPLPAAVASFPAQLGPAARALQQAMHDAQQHIAAAHAGSPLPPQAGPVASVLQQAMHEAQQRIAAAHAGSPVSPQLGPAATALQQAMHDAQQRIVAPHLLLPPARP